MPETTARYYEGFLLEGWIESLDGSIRVPFHDPMAAQLGLREGSLLVGPGTFAAGGSAPAGVSVINASLFMPLCTSQALFRSNLTNYDDAVRIVLRNLGAKFEIGLGPGYTVRNAISEPGIRGAGPIETAGLTGRVTLNNPEPSSWLMLAGALTALCLLRHRLKPVPRTAGYPVTAARCWPTRPPSARCGC